MLKKLINGELSLRDTFWMFGFLGLPTITLVVRILGKMLVRRLNSQSILAYLLSLKIDHEFSTSILVVLYLSALGFFVFYVIALFMGTWRSSAEYNHSLWFRHLSRIFMVLMLFLAVKCVFNL